MFPALSRPNKRQRFLTFATETKGKLIVTDDAKEKLQVNATRNPTLNGSDLKDVGRRFPSAYFERLCDDEAKEKLLVFIR